MLMFEKQNPDTRRNLQLNSHKTLDSVLHPLIGSQLLDKTFLEYSRLIT